MYVCLFSICKSVSVPNLLVCLSYTYYIICTGWAKKVIPLVQFQNTQTLTVNKLNIQRRRPKIVVIMTSYS